MVQGKRILAVVDDAALYRQLEELLRRTSFDVNRVPSAAGALVLLGNTHYDLVLAGAPLPDLGLQEFLNSVRALDLQGRSSPVLVLVPAEHVATLAKALKSEPAWVVPHTAGLAQIQRAVSQMLGVAARASRRLLVGLEVEVGRRRQQRVVQTCNISTTGLLLRGRPPQVGARLELSFSLPGAGDPLRAEGEVVRHTDPDKEGLVGFGVRFVEMSQEDRERLAEFVRGELETDPAEERRAAGVAFSKG